MAFGDKRRERHRLEAEAARAAAHDHWQAQVDTLHDHIDAVSTWFGLAPDDPSLPFIQARSGEKVYGELDGAALIEPRRSPGHYQGGSQGVSFHVAKGVSYRVGAMKGTYVPGPEAPTPIDHGLAVISDQRVTFAGPKATREWLFSKLIGYEHDAGSWTVIQVSNRQKASGIGYDAQHAEDVRFRLDLAIATYAGRRPALAAKLQERLTALEATEPPRAPAEQVQAAVLPVDPPALQAPPPTPPASWYRDPTNPAQLRYWDGARWTEATAHP